MFVCRFVDTVIVIEEKEGKLFDIPHNSVMYASHLNTRISDAMYRHRKGKPDNPYSL